MDFHSHSVIARCHCLIILTLRHMHGGNVGLAVVPARNYYKVA